MNEKRNASKNFRSPESTQEMDWAQLLGLVSSAESRAKVCGAFAIARQAELLRKTMARSNTNKKLMRSIQSKLEKLEYELSQKSK